ncbi:MAG: hypothetical protein HY237_11510 [Acidobacteria bacterium]|nr:hypothetical protein [Acidobacteriota bacterium]
MSGPVHCIESYPGSSGIPSFREAICLASLRTAQNPDGGWGYRPAQRSATEPTCWSMLALAGGEERLEAESATMRGIRWLLAVQLPDGSWPAYPGQDEGCWVTSLACLTLHQLGVAPEAVTKGIDWLGDAWPGEGRLWQRILRRLSSRPAVTRQNHSLRGWSWTRGTSSWVEPTACALILLHNIFGPTLPRRLAKRRRLAEAMLYDRMCPNGGWNSGNPFVYGVAGEPLVGPTVWALLALQRHQERAENQRSLDWLASVSERTPGPSSLALAHLCLETYGRPTQELEPALRRLYATNEFLQNIPALAHAALALDPTRTWLQVSTKGGGRS